MVGGRTDRLDFAVTGGGGVLSFAAIPDYELPADSGGNNVYDITVNALDSEGETGRLDVTVTITNENERPVVKRRSGTGPFSIVENSATDVGSFVATDPEGGGVTWSLETSGDHGRFEIDAANGALSFKEAPDYESSDLGLGPDKAYTVTVQATEVDDGKPLTLEADGPPRRDRHHHRRERAADNQRPGRGGLHRERYRNRRDVQRHGSGRGRHAGLVPGGRRRG